MKEFIGDRIWRLGYDFYADIAEKIVSERRKKKLTQEQLANLSGLTKSKLAKYENVSIRMRISEIEKMSKALDVSVDFLIGAIYDDPDCQKCLYIVRNQRIPNFALYFEAKSPQEAFLVAYEWSIDMNSIWFESRDRALVRLVGVPVRKSDYAHFKKRTSEEDEILPDAVGSAERERGQARCKN